MVKANIQEKMEIFMKGNGKKIQYMDMEYLNKLMEIVMKEIG